MTRLSVTPTRLPLACEAATLALGAALASGARPGQVLFLSGDLGAGKTTLTRGLLRALGWGGRVKSPTYTLLEFYAISRLNLYHFDFYRFKDHEEWVSSGFREHFNPQSLCIVEWPEKAADLLAPPDLHITLQIASTHPEDARRASFLAHSASGREWCRSALASLLPH
ncbi:MAG: tRNA (adenosine(37)-N6)-threonylcarbamoyltransferase complex ATPase subunit type 1 TsaE [Betaproteobacteria bacterium]|nr:tRNA (adenosine(37)-N6)-threonylcarbamoyltransferase complex ATPase subunit type 1 TsaE [Betaproteobacteria bacterium]